MVNNYLAHHGVLGMKWGKRRYQNKDGTLTAEGKKRYGTIGPNTRVRSKQFYKEKDKLTKKHWEEDDEYAKAERLKKKAMDLYDKYDFDGDDGGGGRTRADEKAGEKYMELWEQVDEIEWRIRERADKKTADDLINKYGEKRVRDIQRATNAKAVAVVASFVALPIAISAIKNS